MKKKFEFRDMKKNEWIKIGNKENLSKENFLRRRNIGNRNFYNFTLREWLLFQLLIQCFLYRK